MKSNLYIIFKFIGFLLAILMVSFAMQLHFASFYAHFKISILIESYIVNIVMAVGIFSLLIFLKEKHTPILGFVYMGGSLIKFAVFFAFFNPIFKKDGNIDALESLSFLVPYFICLFFETSHLIRLINK